VDSHEDQKVLQQQDPRDDTRSHREEAKPRTSKGPSNQAAEREGTEPDEHRDEQLVLVVLRASKDESREEQRGEQRPRSRREDCIAGSIEAMACVEPSLQPRGQRADARRDDGHHNVRRLHLKAADVEQRTLTSFWEQAVEARGQVEVIVQPIRGQD
jgi:hypothetical protein